MQIAARTTLPHIITIKVLTKMAKPVQLYASEDVIEEFYKALLNPDSRAAEKVHIPRSDVFYVRTAIEADTGVRYTLDHVERAMYLEGYLRKQDVLDPNRKRPYADAPEAWLQERIHQLPG